MTNTIEELEKLAKAEGIKIVDHQVSTHDVGKISRLTGSAYVNAAKPYIKEVQKYIEKSIGKKVTYTEHSAWNSCIFSASRSDEMNNIYITLTGIVVEDPKTRDVTLKLNWEDYTDKKIAEWRKKQK